MSDPDALRARVQAVLGADLRIERELGRGGMAVVYQAHDIALQRSVAVKVLYPELVDQEGVAERFIREARTVAALQHPHVVSVYGVRSGNGIYAIVMQFVAGHSLESLLLVGDPLPLAQGARLLAQVASGLEHAHSRGVVHRDVKPANVLVDTAGQAYVSDFGIARRDDGLVVTKTGMVLGTWGYMAPEQRAGERVTTAADQYALGMMAFELLTGHLPFKGEPDQVLRAHMETPPPSLRSLRPAIPADVDAVVLRMLAKDPAERLPSLAVAIAAFEALALAAGHPTRRRSPTLAAAGVAAVVVVAGIWWAVRTPSAESDAAGAAPAAAAAAPAAARATPIPTTASANSDIPRATPVAPSRVESAQGEPTRVPRAPAPRASEPARIGAKPPVTVPSSATSGTAVAAPGPSPAAPTAAPPTTAPASPPVVAPAAPSASADHGASVADARAIARAFVTLLNQRQRRSVQLLAALPGDVSRAQLLSLVESAPDFAAGFDRIASAPVPTADGFETECTLDLEWRGGRTRLLVRLAAARRSGEWTLIGFAASPAP
jgi:serine/threonine-protein kinase